MADIVSPEKRSRMMSGIRGKDTVPELVIRKGLHGKGIRYKLHVTDLPGKPDLVFPKYSAVIFVHGCFWHGHDCPLFKMPSSRRDFWKEKIQRNQKKDTENLSILHEKGWRVLTIWECVLKGPGRLPVDQVISRAEEWLLHGYGKQELRGTGKSDRPLATKRVRH